MLRANEHNREIRECNFVFVPDCAKHFSPAWGCQSNVSGVLAWSGKTLCRSREIWTSISAIHRRCKSFAFAILAAVSVEQTSARHNTSSSANSTSADRRSGAFARNLDSKTATQGAAWINSPSSSGATGTMVRTAVRVARTGTTRPRTRTTTSVRAASVRTKIWVVCCSAVVTARQAGLFLCGQPCFPASANTFGGLVERLVANMANSAASFAHD